MTSADNQAAIDWSAELTRHREWMLGVARSRLGDEHAADDVLQDVSLSVIKQNGRPTDRGKIRAWLYQVVVRRTADYFRKSYRQDQLFADVARQSDSETVDPDWVMSREPPDLRAALETLSEDERQIFVLKYVENWSYGRLAEQFAISERAVEYRLVRAKERLRTALRSQRTGGEEE